MGIVCAGSTFFMYNYFVEPANGSCGCFLEPSGELESPSLSLWDWACGLVQLGQMRRHHVPFLYLSLFPPHQSFYVSDFVKTE